MGKIKDFICFFAIIGISAMFIFAPLGMKITPFHYYTLYGVYAANVLLHMSAALKWYVRRFG